LVLQRRARRQGLGSFGAGARAQASRRARLPSTVVVVALLVVVRFEWLWLIIGIQDHAGKSTNVAIVAPPSGSEHRVVAVRTLARWRLAFKGGFEAGSHNREKMAKA
jgi:hypothetical protein